MTACISKLGLAEKSYPSSWALNKISKAKDRVIGPDEYVKEFGGSEPLAAQIAEIYRTYQDALTQYNALDFDDLIIKALELFYMNPDVLESVSYTHLLRRNHPAPQRQMQTRLPWNFGICCGDRMPMRPQRKNYLQSIQTSRLMLPSTTPA